MKSLLNNFVSARVGEGTMMFANSFNISVVIGTGTLVLERSFDGGQYWFVVETFTSSYEDMMTDPEGALYRWRCSVYTAGPIIGRLGQ